MASAATKRARTTEDSQKARRVATDVSAYIERLQQVRSTPTDVLSHDANMAIFDDSVMFCILERLDRRSLVRYSCCDRRAHRISSVHQERLWERLFVSEFHHMRHNQALATVAPSFKTRCRLASTEMFSSSSGVGSSPLPNSRVQQINDMFEFRIGSKNGALDSAVQLTQCNSKPEQDHPPPEYYNTFQPLKIRESHLTFEAAFPDAAPLDSALLFRSGDANSPVLMITWEKVTIYARRRLDSKVARLLDISMTPEMNDMRDRAYTTHYHHSWLCQPEPPWQACSYPKLRGDATCEAADDEEHEMPRRFEMPRWKRVRFKMRFGAPVRDEEDDYDDLSDDEPADYVNEESSQRTCDDASAPALCGWERDGPTAFLKVLEHLEWM